MEFNEVDYARSVFEAEIEELGRIKNSLDGDITKVVELILGMKGNISFNRNNGYIYELC